MQSWHKCLIYRKRRTDSGTDSKLETIIELSSTMNVTVKFPSFFDVMKPLAEDHTSVKTYFWLVNEPLFPDPEMWWGKFCFGFGPYLNTMIPTMGPYTHYSLGGACAWLRMSAGWCIYICCLEQTWIRSFVSLSWQMRICLLTLQAKSSALQIADDIRMMLSSAQPYSGAEPSVACIRSGTAKCKRTILAQPKLSLKSFASVNGCTDVWATYLFRYLYSTEFALE